MEKESFSNFKEDFKWLGIIDYKSLIILLIYLIILWNLSGLFINNIIYRIYIEVILAIPIFGFFYSNKSSENVSDIIYVILKFVFSPKLYVYRIESNNNVLK